MKARNLPNQRVQLPAGARLENQKLAAASMTIAALMGFIIMRNAGDSIPHAKRQQRPIPKLTAAVTAGR
jgi:hypothetical protein